ncbi:DegQ family serine endoprotease [Sulfurospirillum barnesii]|uniref:Periplasmic serine protease, Do/DeqQ family n=1 Tax=Sulfurospirillum barnesii (strain ATCC 700032 / DSM 10660 / SES-3) TaxID=760154 RepID=I3XXQ9_SULBS|nr:DegQ family serine endoprotease [Sulfurospirillum barnesii]AFL68733.1 periplasmic serine protease, Do/DeqQ family [Sulfurospirillum barnesii SES-3]
MNKIISLSLFTALSLFGASVTLEQMPQDSQRIDATTSNVIISYHNAIKESKKSVVNIATTKKTKQNEQLNELMQNPFFKEFFGNRMPEFRQQERKSHSLGSGVIISKDGYIVTNNHVVEGADEIVITLPNDEKEYKAKVIGEDPKTDLAVVKIDATNLHVAKFGDSSNLLEGDLVFAIGNPFGVGETITQGIISALNKSNVGLNQYENFIQTDASINPGNSGGALVDSRGALIGINSAILSRSGGNNGIGFAIPSNMVQKIASSLIENGKVERGFMGVSIADLTKDLKELYDNKQGAVILMIEKNSPAEKGGLQVSDLILEVDGVKIKNANELKNTIAAITPDKSVNITYERDKKIKNTKIKLAKMDSEILTSSDGKSTSSSIEGLSLVEINAQTRKQYQLSKESEGLLVTEVKEDSKAEKIGFRQGDVIIQIEQMRISSLHDFTNALKEYKNSKKRVIINRQNYRSILVMP